MYIDFHTHKQRNKGDHDVIEVVSVHPEKHHINGYFTLGYHPWWTQVVPDAFAMEEIRSFILSDPACLAVGECGMDKLKGPSLDIQESIFRSQVLLANSMNVPVIVHCVRAFDRLLSIRKEIGKTDWVVHGFMRNKILARHLIDQGIYLSMAPYEKMAVSFRETLAYCPSDRFFLETDSDPVLNIRSVYRISAEIRHTDTEALQMQLLNNFKYFFRWKDLSLPGWSAQNC
jgi:TatD DNase family protein